MEMQLENMSDWDRKKAIYLLSTAESLGMNTGSYGSLDVNCMRGYTYIWLEDYNFTLYLPINCELEKSEVYALYSCSYDGEETELQLEDNTSLSDLEKWAEKLSDESQEKDGE